MRIILAHDDYMLSLILAIDWTHLSHGVLSKQSGTSGAVCCVMRLVCN